MKFKDYKLKIHNVEKHVRLNPVMKTKKDYDEEILRLNEYYEKIRTYEKEVEEDKDLTDSERVILVSFCKKLFEIKEIKRDELKNPEGKNIFNDLLLLVKNYDIIRKKLEKENKWVPVFEKAA